MTEEEQEVEAGRRLPTFSMKVKVLASGAAYLSLLAGLLLTSAPLALDQIGSWHFQAPDVERFEIRLLSSGDLVISDEDIVSYNQTSHVIILEMSGIAAIQQLGAIPVNGTGFVVVVDGQAVYAGAFWTSLSSISCDGVVILVETQAQIALKLELGYPSPSFFKGPDPRGDPRIASVFSAVGKLVS